MLLKVVNWYLGHSKALWHVQEFLLVKEFVELQL
ncbi:UNVERIFIED_CONTAM: hypothetical protein GTU68_033820 [Idotea baltica]|nr:hypothetical protein [Idotea baltica]